MQSTLDQSLLDRAHAAASSPALPEITADYELPSWALGAADVRIIYINTDRQAPSIDSGPTLHLGAAGARRGAAAQAPPTSARSRPTAATTAWSPCPARTGRALVLAQSLAPQERVLERLGAGDAAVRAGGRDRRRAGGLGRGPQRPAPGPPADPARSSTSPAPRTSPRCPSRATTRSPGWPPRSTRCSPRSRRPATGSASWSPTPGTSCARRSPRCARTSTCSRRPTARAACRPRRAPSCSTTSAPRSRR